MKIRIFIPALFVLALLPAASLGVTDGTWSVVGSINGLVDPTGITFDGTWIWATEQHVTGPNAPLYRINPGTVTIEETRSIDIADCCVQGLAWDGHHIWISGNGYDIYRYDPQSGDLHKTCSRPGNPQAIGLTAVNGIIHATGWYGGADDCDLMTLDPDDCGYDPIAKLASVAAHGLAWTGTGFLVCMREKGDPTTVKTLFEYNPSGEMRVRYGPADYNGYDVTWDGAYAWVCDYGIQGERDGRILKLRLESHEPVEAYLDIKPGSCPNPFNPGPTCREWRNGNGSKSGVLPAALLGTPAFDVADIDVSTVSLEGAGPLRWEYEDVAGPPEFESFCACASTGPDGFTDLLLKFKRTEVGNALGDVARGEVIPLTLTGELNDGTSFQAVDCVVIVGGKTEIRAAGDNDGIVLNPPTPNPFNPITRISYVLPGDAFVELFVCDAAGRVVEKLLAESQTAGEHVVEFEAERLASGVYFSQLVVGDVRLTRKMILIK